MRTPRLFLGIFALALLLPLLLLACGGSEEPTTVKEEGVFWIFEETGLISRYPSVNWERVTYLLYWSLRISVFALLALLFIVSRIRKSRRSADHFAGYPQVAQGLTTLPSDLPAPAASVLGSRKVGPQTYLSILVDMLQKGNLTITGGYGENEEARKYQSRVWFTRQSEPDQPWEKEVYSALPFLADSDFLKPQSDDLKSQFEGRQKAISTHLDECLQSRGIFDEPPLQVMADRGQGSVARTAWVLATVILAVGTDLGESHTFQYTIDISPPPKKKKTKPAKQRVSITPEERAQRRRAYEQARNQLPHRRELKRRKEKERHEQAKELGLCRTCRSPAMPGRTRCQDCLEKRRLQQIQAREKAIQQKQGTLGQPPLF